MQPCSVLYSHCLYSSFKFCQSMPHWDLLLPSTAVVMLLESLLSGLLMGYCWQSWTHHSYITAQQDGRTSFLHIPAREEHNSTFVVYELTIHDSASVLSTELSAQAVLRVQGMLWTHMSHIISLGTLYNLFHAKPYKTIYIYCRPINYKRIYCSITQETRHTTKLFPCRHNGATVVHYSTA